MFKPERQLVDDYEEDRQTREVYRYFQPKNPAGLNATSPEFNDHVVSIADFSGAATPVVLDSSFSETHSTAASPPSSPNTTLTSFAQLAALRLNAQRAFITILNSESQFILAEATRNTNLQSSKSSLGEADELCTGTSTLSNVWNICQETVALSPDTQDGLYSFLVVNNLEQEDRYKDLPFVKGEPHSHFYAGTPLTSQSGINLGCLFVLDSEPREELSDIEKDTLGKVAELVMDYLLVSRQASEGRRASRLSRGLHLFVDGNSSFASDTHMSARSTSTAHSVSSRTSLHHGSQSVASRNNELKLRPASSEPEDSPSQEDARPVSPNANPNDLSDAPSSTGSIQSSQSATSCAENTSSSNHWLFQRAANLLRQSLDLDGAGGVMFLEAGNNSSEYVADGHCDPAESTKPAPVLALSTRNDPFSYQATSTLSDPAVNLDNAFLKQLTRRYPKGRLWSFHRDGTFSTAEDQPINETRKQRKKSKVSETSKLNELFPDASQVMFVPLWNATDSQWFAGCFCWTPQPTRVFSQAVDLSSVFAFGSSIMTEYSRIESIIADRQKGDFISSISHELRSPLHGVLAAAEFLGSTTLDQYQGNFLDTIDACCRTLLDTMNQVLDFSKIMSLERHKKAFKRGRNPCKTKPTEETETRLDPLILTDLALLTEDVVASVCLGHSHAQRPVTSVDSSTPLSPPSLSETATREGRIDCVPEVDVILDIPDVNWMYKVQPGSLRRLLMNILGNSLKYTTKGRVCVSIATEEHSKSHLRHSGLEDMVTLTILDTGKGISKEYLRRHLFTPFSQEDPLSVGTGLGLSIVRGIVKALNGRIKIRSRQGQGTVVKILLPLERLGGAETPKSPTQEEIPDQNTPMRSSQIPRDLCSGKSAAILGIDPSHLDQDPFWASMARYITDWYGMRLVPFSTDGKIDILFANERDLSTAQMQDIPTELPSLLVFCSDSSSRDDPKAQWSHLADSLAILNRPCGPQKLGRGIWSCLDQTPTSLTSLLFTTGVESVLPERPALARSPPTIGESGLIPLKNGGPPAADPSNPTQGSSNSDMNPSNRGATTNHQQDTPKRVALPTSSLPVRNPPSSSCHSKTSEKESEPRVLVVDDNRINLHLMETFLNKRNIAVLDKADNGRAAVDAVERTTQGYDMIFMDLSMPYMDGFEATRAIRAIEKERNGCPPAKIIAFTGLSSQRDEFKALNSGVDLFLTKPVPFKEVARLVDEWKAQRIG